MNFYYGLVDKATNAWGFVEEIDDRVTEDMVYLTNEQWRTLLNEQSAGKQICYYEGQVFTAEPGRYYLDEQGWHKKTDEEFDTEKATKERENLVQEVYQMKADKAYGGVIINDLLVFETNATAITNTVASLALMADDGAASWKFYTVQGTPHVQLITKAQLGYVAKFGQNMINQCFQVEGQANVELQNATNTQLLNAEWVNTFKTQVKTAMDAVNNKITIQF